MNFKGFNLSGNNMTLYYGSVFMPSYVVLNSHGTLDDCLPKEENRPIVILPSGVAARKFGIGFLKEDQAYQQGKTINLDEIIAIAGYGTTVAWEDFVRRVKLEKLRDAVITSSGIIVLK